jgi:aryl-alcohol dehydrogenase-like predicted oxidoreductase
MTEASIPPPRTLRRLSRSDWLDGSELRIGLGCMRLSTDADRHEERGAEVIAAALQAGITVFDTARAYGDNERLLAESIRRSGAQTRAHIITKGGMTRTGGAWIPDGRAKAIRADCEASLAALDGLPIDLLLVHAPDPQTPWPTSLRALAALVDAGLVRNVGVSNVNRRQLDEALELAPVAAVEIALSLIDDRGLRGGVLDRCAERGIPVIAHSPLGGPRRAGELAHSEAVAGIAAAHAASPAEVALAWLLGLSPTLIAIPGARRPETARSCARAAQLTLDATERAQLDRAFRRGGPRPARRPRTDSDGEVVIIMGIPGAGKSRIAAQYVEDGFLRLNRDERGGRLRGLADVLNDQLGSGTARVVLDNTYLTREARSRVIDAAAGHGLPVRCVWIDIPLAQAQVNLVERLLDRFGALPGPDELRRLGRREPGVMAPTSQMRTLRELEPPSLDEGFARVDVVPFTRADRARPGGTGVFVAAAALQTAAWREAVAGGEAPHLVFDWHPAGDDAALRAGAAQVAAVVGGPVDSALCPHPAGPPRCWCRPPLPGLLLAFARAHDLDPSRSTLVGCRPTDRTLANTVGARYVDVS